MTENAPITETPPQTNRHPVDELADVRAQIKELKDREDDLKVIISLDMGDGDSLGGDEYIATQTLSTRKGAIDEKALKAAGVNVSDFRKADVTVWSLRLERRATDEGDMI